MNHSPERQQEIITSVTKMVTKLCDAAKKECDRQVALPCIQIDTSAMHDDLDYCISHLRSTLKLQRVFKDFIQELESYNWERCDLTDRDLIELLEEGLQNDDQHT